jgi:hypothetical protein
MRLLAAALIAVLGAGCASHARVNVNATSGTSGSTSSVQVRSYSGSDLITLLGISMVVGTIVELERSRVPELKEKSRYGVGAYSAVASDPPMVTERTIAEQDCTRPIDEFAGNLRCK